MYVVGHDGIGVKPVETTVPIFEELLLNSLCEGWFTEQGSPLPRVGCDKVGRSGFRAVLGSRHTLQGLKPHLSDRPSAAGLKPRPSVAMLPLPTRGLSRVLQFDFRVPAKIVSIARRCSASKRCRFPALWRGPGRYGTSSPAPRLQGYPRRRLGLLPRRPQAPGQ